VIELDALTDAIVRHVATCAAAVERFELEEPAAALGSFQIASEAHGASRALAELAGLDPPEQWQELGRELARQRDRLSELLPT
jgi:uncharacterized protein YhfF